MTESKYRDITAKDIPLIVEGDCKVRLIAGAYRETKGPMEAIAVQATYMDVEVKATGSFSLDVDPSDTLFIYVIEGEAVFEANGDMSLPKKRAVLFALLYITVGGSYNVLYIKWETS